MDEQAHSDTFFGTLQDMHPVLRPGVHLLRRGDGQLQLGLDPSRAVVLPDSEAVRGALAKLRVSTEHSAFSDPDELAVLELFAGNELLVDSDQLLPFIPACPPAGGQTRRSRSRTPAVSRADVAALARTTGDQASGILRSRGRFRVRLQTFGGPGGEPMRDELEVLLRRAGLTVAPARGTGRKPNLVVLLGVGEPERETVDPLMRDGTAHLLLRVSEGSVTVGPFVSPGETACLRCIDGHHTDADPSWPLLVNQYAGVAGLDRADGMPEPVDGLSVSVGVAWAAREVASYAEGRPTSTWSSTIRLDPCLTCFESRSWLRHPACGCTWG